MKTLQNQALRGAILMTAVSLCTALAQADNTTDRSTTATRSNDASAVENRRVTNATTVNTGVELKRADRNFFEKAAKSGMKEVAVSRAVSTRLMNPQVKQFADMMVSDHTNANAKLRELAQRKGVMLPVVDEMKLMDKWSKQDDDLDEDYMEEMVSDHKDAVELFEKATKSEDPDIAAFAMETLPKLQRHLQMARDLEKMLD